MHDLLITNGLIVDGGGRPARPGDIAIRDGLIVEMGPGLSGPARQTLNAQGRAVTPGFIDVHSHDDLVFFDDPENRPKLLQGVTTVVAGNCGFGPCPCDEAHREALAAYARPVLGDGVARHVFPDFAAYAGALAKLPKALNIAAFLAHGALYIHENGFSDVKPDTRGAENMRAHLRRAMEAGAAGLSLGLMYAPGCYCGPADLQPLAEVAAEYGGLVNAHLRSESEDLVPAIEELLALQKATGVSVHLSHLKKVGRGFRGDIGRIVARLEAGIRDGLDLSFDMYPYPIGSTTMSVLLPPPLLAGGIAECLERLRDPAVRARVKLDFERPWAEADNLAWLCGWDGILIASASGRPDAAGRSLAELAAADGLDPGEACLRLFEAAGGQATVLLRNMEESDLRDIIRSPHCLVASDGLPAGPSPHPRLYGNFPRFLEKFVLEEKILTLEEAIRKITSMPARRFGLGRRGLLEPEYHADLVIFDPAGLKDRSTFQNPRQHPEGLSHVIAGGEIVAETGRTTGRRPGRFLKYERPRPKD